MWAELQALVRDWRDRAGLADLGDRAILNETADQLEDVLYRYQLVRHTENTDAGAD